MPRGRKKSNEKKLPFGLTETFIADIDAADRAKVSEIIVRLQKDLEDAQTFLDENSEIITLKERLKDLVTPSRETLKVIKNKTKYSLKRLKELGAI